MKALRLFLTIGCLLTLLTFTACNPKIENPTEVLSADALNTESTSVLQDGTYQAVGRYLNPHGYGIKMTAEVHQNIITKVHYEEVDLQGNQRPDTRWDSSEKSLRQTISQLYSLFIEHQSPDFDTITGATESSEAFKALAQCILDSAASGDTSIAVTDAYTQTYTAESQPDLEGYRGKLSITFREDTIIQVSYDEVEGSNIRSSNIALKQAFTAMTKETMEQQDLSPISGSPASAESTSRYNDLLQSISLQRVAFISQ